MQFVRRIVEKLHTFKKNSWQDLTSINLLFLKFHFFQEKPTNKKIKQKWLPCLHADFLQLGWKPTTCTKDTQTSGKWEFFSRKKILWRGMLCSNELVGITKMMLENRVNITSLHPCFPVTCNIGKDKKTKIVKLPKKNTCLTHSCVEPKRATLRELRLCSKCESNHKTRDEITGSEVVLLILHLIPQPKAWMEQCQPCQVNFFFCWELSPNLCSQKLCFA